MTRTKCWLAVGAVVAMAFGAAAAPASAQDMPRHHGMHRMMHHDRMMMRHDRMMMRHDRMMHRGMMMRDHHRMMRHAM